MCYLSPKVIFGISGGSKTEWKQATWLMINFGGIDGDGSAGNIY